MRHLQEDELFSHRSISNEAWASANKTQKKLKKKKDLVTEKLQEVLKQHGINGDSKDASTAETPYKKPQVK